MRFSVVMLLLFMAARGESAFKFRKATPASIELTDNGKPVFVYNHGMILKEGVSESRRRSDYVHPVYTPGGTVVTDDFPADHLHHRGISWMWPVVKIGNEVYNLWEIHGIRQRFVRWRVREGGPHLARLGVENGWFVGERKVVREVVEIVAHPVKAGGRVLDFALSFEALDQPVEIAGESQHGKGYGGFGVRFTPRKGTIITTDTGKEDRDTDLIRHAWAQLEADFEGRHAGTRVDIEQMNPDSPNGWCLRHYGYLGVDFPGLAPYRLTPGKVLTLKYRVTVFER